MARCCWGRRGSCGLRTEQLEEERETYRNEVRRYLAKVCDWLGTGLVTVERVLTVAHTDAIRTPCGYRG